MTLDQFIDRAIMVPFVIGGRDWSGWDCWGLIYCAHRDVPALGGPVASYAHEYDDHLTYRELARLIEREKSEWRSITDAEIKPGSISLYRVSRYASHVALVIAGRKMLHCEHSVGTVLEPLANLVWAGRHVGYFTRDHDV